MSLEKCRPDEEFATASCLTGCGGVSGNEYFHAEFPSFIQDLDLHINALELLTIVVALRIWGHKFKGKRLVVHCDNLSSCLVLNKGSTRCGFMQACLREDRQKTNLTWNLVLMFLSLPNYVQKTLSLKILSDVTLAPLDR